MAGCSLRDRDLRAKHEDVNSRTRASSARAPSQSPQGETSKEGPRGAAIAGQESRLPEKSVVTGHS